MTRSPPGIGPFNVRRMSSQTIDDTRRKRVQRARKRGLTPAEIAAREQVSTRTIERLVSGRRFQETLRQLRPQPKSALLSRQTADTDASGYAIEWRPTKNDSSESRISPITVE